MDKLADFEGVRLIVQGTRVAGASAFLSAVMRDIAGRLGFVYLAEFAAYLRDHRVEVPADVWDLNYHLVGLDNSADVSGIIARIIHHFAVSEGPYVERVEPDLLFHLNTLPSKIGSGFNLCANHPTYRSQVDVSTAGGSVTGSQVTVAVVDSGVEPTVLSTPFHDFVLSGNTSHQDGHGHGTAMISIIKDVAPGASIHAVRVTDSGQVRLWDLMAGISAAVLAIQADIVCLSLGLTSVDKTCSHCGGIGTNRSFVFEQFLDTAGRGISGSSLTSPLFVAAVGNDGPSAAFEWPARFDQVLAVGATNANKELASFSNKGTPKDRYALCPGGEWNNATNTASEWVGEGSDGGTKTLCLGTSAATAYASAVLALCRQHFVDELTRNGYLRKLLGADLLDEALSRCATDIAPSYNKQDHGAGRLVFDSSPYTKAGTPP